MNEETAAWVRAGTRLEASLSETPEALQISWSLTSDLRVPLVVLRHIHRSFDLEGRLLVERNVAYVAVGEQGDVTVSKELMPVPPRGVHVMTPFVPLGEELAPGARIGEVFSLQKPVTAWDPYSEILRMVPGYRAMQPVTATRVRFRLGVYLADAERPHQRVETALGALIYPDYRPVLDAQIVLDAPPLMWAGTACR